MKRILIATLLLLAWATGYAITGDRPSKDSNQKRTELAAPYMKALVQYDGGDTLYLAIDKEDAERVQIKLLGGAVVLLSDGLGRTQQLRRTYVISKLPEGKYKIRLKKGNYVVEKTLLKQTPAIDSE
ncbi:MAG: hypothetical protein V4651_12495 [Bacteroidota bacterium]